VALIRRIDTALVAAGRFLAGKQASDGAWRSQVYGVFRDGPALTPHVLGALFLVSRDGDTTRAAFRKGVGYVVRMAGADGKIDAGAERLAYPVYTSAEASWVVVAEEPVKNARARDTWLAYLRARQLDEPLGWVPSEPFFGGWGYAVALPRKPGPGELAEPPVEANLSASTFALDALAAAKVPARDPAYRKALAFVQRCQNFAEDAREADPRFDDGGFFFAPGDLSRNKAGMAGTDARSRARFASYGGATADGLRALLHCGLPPDHPRAVAARQWLESHFSARTNPGSFAADREVIRDATYYYYCCSLAQTFARLDLRALATPSGKVRWAEALAEELIRRQRPDGSWVNRFKDTKEDDPLVATPSAAAALARCRRALAGP
jgi:squalene-hopene/tetraprenyl-beta-curcumene cyclase